MQTLVTCEQAPDEDRKEFGERSDLVRARRGPVLRYNFIASARLYTPRTCASYPGTDNVTETNIVFPVKDETH